MTNALFTISDDRFAFATYVMISSFLEHNKWFDGDIVVLLNSPLSEKSTKHISELYNKIELRVVDEEKYVNALDHFKQQDSLFRYWPHMLKFEAFSVEKYDRVVFLDSDILVLKDISRLFLNDYDYVICEDRVREEQFELGLGERQWDGVTYLNSGVFSVKSPRKENFDELISIAESYEVNCKFFGECCEQDVINEFLSKKHGVTLFGVEYNSVQSFYLESIGRKVGSNERILHYFTECKPWGFIYDDYWHVHEIWRNYLRGLSAVEMKKKTVVL